MHKNLPKNTSQHNTLKNAHTITNTRVPTDRRMDAGHKGLESRRVEVEVLAVKCNSQ